MAKKDNIHPVLQLIKSEAKELQVSAKSEGKILIYGHALDQASKLHGYKDWNTACGLACNTDVLAANRPPKLFIDTESHPPLSDKERELYEMCAPLGRSEQNNKKVYYSKRNHLMDEYADLLNDPMYEEIPYEIETIEEMSLWVKKRGGGLFYPTASIADLKSKTDPEVAEIITANFNTRVLLGRNGIVVPFEFQTNHDNPFVIGPSGAGQSFFIKDLIRQAQEENPSFSEEEAEGYIYKKYRIQTFLDTGESYDEIILKASLDQMDGILRNVPDDVIKELVNMPIPIHNAISRGSGAYQNEMIRKISMIHDEADRRGLSYVIKLRDDTGFGEALLHNIATKIRKHGGKSTRAFVRDINNKHTKRNFKK